MKAIRCLVFSACLLPALALAQVRVTDAWVRATVSGQRTTGAFMTLASNQDVALVAASSPIAASVEIHEMKMDGGVMTMRAVDRVAIRRNAPLKLESGGYHVMLMGLSKPVAAGEQVPITLTFEDSSGKRSNVDVTASVRPLAGGHGGMKR